MDSMTNTVANGLLLASLKSAWFAHVVLSKTILCITISLYCTLEIKKDDIKKYQANQNYAVCFLTVTQRVW